MGALRTTACLLAGLALGARADPLPTPLTRLQPLIDATPVGGVLVPPPGRYAGPVVVDRAMTLDGRGAVVVDGGGQGTVVTVKAAGAVVRGLHVTNSGTRFDALDCGVLVEGAGARVETNTVDDVLFGVAVQGVDDVMVCGNTISSRPEEPGLRGDAVRVWNAARTQVVGNDVFRARDIALDNARDSRVVGNRIQEGRFGAQLVFAPRSRVERNWMSHNQTGIAVLYSDDVWIANNRIQHSFGAAGACLAFKESSLAVVEENVILHCAVGAKTNAPTALHNIIYFRKNLFAHNVTAMDFYGENGGHVIHRNRFQRNLVQVTVSAPMSARGNHWLGNIWDDYEGFDQDHNGIGDVPYEIYWFADRIWMEEPRATFFRGSPLMELVDFLERLAPFAAPELILRDDRPRVAVPAPITGADAEQPPAFTPWCP